MFFANSLGPAEEPPPTPEGLYRLAAARFPGRDGVPSHEIFAVLDAIVREKGLKLSAAGALELIAQAGLLRFDAETNTAYFVG
ncbi:MAG TPA: hypothetical protein VM915_17240 [Verrucomicrobiae bacterium]|nr:hypothetical protein [Verrucomicrobiae bacterium]